MSRARRLAAVLTATAALATPAVLATPAQAVGHGHTKTKTAHGKAGTKATKAPKATKVSKAQTKQLLKDVAGKDKRLVRLETSNAVTRLADDTEASLVANIETARTALGDVKTAAEAADTTLDTRAARAELRSFRVENFRLVVNVLKQAEGLAEAAATDAVAQAHLDEAEAAALAITATSSKADIRAARTHLQEARAELGLTDDAETTDTTESTDTTAATPTA